MPHGGSGTGTAAEKRVILIYSNKKNAPVSAVERERFLYRTENLLLDLKGEAVLCIGLPRQMTGGRRAVKEG